MNKFKKMMSVTLAGCMAASALMMSAGAVNIPTDTSPAYMAEDSQVTTHILSFEEMNAITPYKTESAQVFLARNNSAGDQGTACGEFTADAKNASFMITYAPATATYNVQLYRYMSNGSATRVSAYNKLTIGVGAAFSNLQVGATYFFKVSSSDCPVKGTNALKNPNTPIFITMISQIMKAKSSIW